MFRSTDLTTQTICTQDSISVNNTLSGDAPQCLCPLITAGYTRLNDFDPGWTDGGKRFACRSSGHLGNHNSQRGDQLSKEHCRDDEAVERDRLKHRLRRVLEERLYGVSFGGDEESGRCADESIAIP